jgi:WD40 repeat protein
MINIYSIHDGRLLHVLQGLTSDPETIAFSPDGKLLASGSHDARILVWEIPDQTEE